MRRFFLFVISFLVFISINGCYKNEGYGSEEAIKKGDVVYQNKVFNLGRFEQFLTNLSNNKEDTIRVTGYTEEGNPIFQDLQFNGKSIHYSQDNSNDEFGGNNTGIETDVCTKIIEEENAQGEIDYLISRCSKNPDNNYFLIRV